MKSSVSNYESNFYLSGVKILGVSDLNFGYSVPVEHLNVIGNNKFATFTSGPPQGSLSVQKYLSPNDFLLNYTGEIPASGGLFYNNKNFTFQSAYLNSFNVSCAVGNFPQLSADFMIFGNVGAGLSFTTNSTTGTLSVVRPGDILIQCDGTGTNRVEAFTYSVECNRLPFYHPTGSGPIDVRTTRPYRVNAQFTIGVYDYESKKAFDYIVDSNKRNINITIGSLATFTVNNMEFIGESINSSATDEVSMTLNYQGFI
jgi:hypothetical protein